MNVYFFGKQFDKSAKYAKLIRNPLGLDKAYEAMVLAHLGKQDEASKAASQAIKLEPSWNAEQYLSNMGYYADAPAELLIEGARKAGLPACVGNDAASKQASLVRVESCDAERAKAASG